MRLRFWQLLSRFFDRWSRWADRHIEELEYLRDEAAAIQDGSRVRMVCLCKHGDHAGVWRTSWTPRRTGIKSDPRDYRLVRESDGKTDYARADVLELVPEEPKPFVGFPDFGGQGVR